MSNIGDNKFKGIGRDFSQSMARIRRQTRNLFSGKTANKPPITAEGKKWTLTQEPPPKPPQQHTAQKIDPPQPIPQSAKNFVKLPHQKEASPLPPTNVVQGPQNQLTATPSVAKKTPKPLPKPKAKPLPPTPPKQELTSNAKRLTITPNKNEGPSSNISPVNSQGSTQKPKLNQQEMKKGADRNQTIADNEFEKAREAYEQEEKEYSEYKNPVLNKIRTFSTVYKKESSNAIDTQKIKNFFKGNSKDEPNDYYLNISIFIASLKDQELTTNINTLLKHLEASLPDITSRQTTDEEYKTAFKNYKNVLSQMHKEGSLKDMSEFQGIVGDFNAAFPEFKIE